MVQSTIVKRRPFTVRVTEPVYQKLRKICFDSDAAFQDVVEAAIAAHVADSAAERKKARNPFYGVTAEESRVLVSILDLLRDGPEDARDIVVSTLRYVAKARKPKRVSKK